MYPNLLFLVYEAHYPHICQVHASNSASVSYLIDPHIKPRLHEIIKRIVTLHPEQQRLEFTGQHYALIALQFIYHYITPYRSRSQTLCYQTIFSTNDPIILG